VQDLAVMTFSVDEQKNKVLVYAGVPNSAAKRGLVVLDWLRASLAPINGKGGGGKLVMSGLAQGQVKSSTSLSVNFGIRHNLSTMSPGEFTTYTFRFDIYVIRRWYCCDTCSIPA
jgi:alanyl-tRNA synthetase